MACKICGSHTNILIGKPRVGMIYPRNDQDKYTIMQCTACGFYYMEPEIDLTQEEWSLLYENSYFSNHHITRWHWNLRNTERKFRLEIIRKYLNTSAEPQRFLDCGCGEGFMLQAALNDGFEVHGIDIANNLHNSVDMRKIHFMQGNLVNASYPDNYFSAIYLDSVLEHIDRPMHFLQELRRILRPEGVLLIIVPNEDSLINDVIKVVYLLAHRKEKYGKIKPFVPPYHIQGFNSRSLSMALSLSEFKELEKSQFGGTYTMWRAYSPASATFWRDLFLYPFGFLSILVNRQIQLMIIARK